MFDFWKGKRVIDMSKEELLEIISHLWTMWEREKRELSRRTEFLLSLRR